MKCVSRFEPRARAMVTVVALVLFAASNFAPELRAAEAQLENKTVITFGPARTVDTTTATFAFAANPPGSRFEGSLDGTRLASSRNATGFPVPEDGSLRV